MRRRLLALLPWGVLAAGALGLAALRAADPSDPAAAASRPAAGSFWSAEDARGEPLAVTSARPGITLAPGDVFRLRDSDGDGRRIDRIVVRAQLSMLGTVLELTLRESEGRSYVVALLPGDPGAVLFAYREPGREPEVLARARLVDVPGVRPDELVAGVQLTVRASRSSYVVAVNGRDVLTCTDRRLVSGSARLSVRDGAANLLSVSVDGTTGATDGASAPFARADSFGLAAPGPWRHLPASLALALAAVALASIYLRALCLGRPPLSRLMKAGAVVGACAALPVAASLVVVVPALPFVAAVAGAAGLAPGLALLQPHVRRVEPRSAWDRRAGAAIVLLLLGGSALAVAARHREAVAPWIEAERAALAAGPGPAFRLPEPLHLDAGNALSIAGPQRDFRITGSVAVAPGSLLELRLRAAAPPSARGIALWLPTDPRLRAGFVVEDRDACGPLGSSAPAVPAGRSLALEITVRGRDFEAQVDGQRVAATDLRFASGGVVILASNGAADVTSLDLQPLPAAGAADSSGAAGAAAGAASSSALDWARWSAAAVAPAGLVLLVAALAAWLLALPLGRLVEGCAFALVPVIVGFRIPGPGAGLTPQAVAQVAFGVVVLLLVPTFVHSATLTPRRGAALLLAAAAGAPAAVALASPPVTWPATLHWRFDRLEDDLAWLQHPMLRNLNDSLSDHRFRGRAFAERKPPGTARVITLGGSSTWGFAVPVGSGQEYPAVLERLLNEPSPAGAPAARRVEVINGAVLGATGERQFRLLRDVLLRFQPDVVTWSLVYNDCLALNFEDEAAMLAHFSADGYRRSLLDELVMTWRFRRAQRLLTALDAAFSRWTGTTLDLWRAIGARPGEPTAPERFERQLRRLADLARQRGFALVLVKEPMREQHTLWREEFFAVIDRVAAEYGLPVVDPAPALAAAGGRTLFMDVVHPRPEALAIIAEQLAPAVRALLGR